MLLIVVLPLLAVICCPGKEKEQACARREFDGEEIRSGEYPVVTDHHGRSDTTRTA
jgi:hypothetical protein